MTNYPATHAVLDGARGSGRRRTPAQWIAAIFEQQAVVLELEAENAKLEWQRGKAARVAGIDLSELDEAWSERKNP